MEGECFRIVDSLFSHAHRGKEPSRITCIFSFSHPPTSLHQQHQLRNAPTYLLLHVSPSLRSSLFSLATSCSPLATPISTLPICVAELKISSSLTLLSYPRPRLSIPASLVPVGLSPSCHRSRPSFRAQLRSRRLPHPIVSQLATLDTDTIGTRWTVSPIHPSDRPTLGRLVERKNTANFRRLSCRRPAVGHTMFAALTVRCDSSPAASTATATSRNTVGTLADGSVTASELPAPMPVTALAVAPQAPWRLPRPSYPSPSHYYSYSSCSVCSDMGHRPRRHLQILHTTCRLSASTLIDATDRWRFVRLLRLAHKADWKERQRREKCGMSESYYLSAKWILYLHELQSASFITASSTERTPPCRLDTATGTLIARCTSEISATTPTSMSWRTASESTDH